MRDVRYCYKLFEKQWTNYSNTLLSAAVCLIHGLSMGWEVQTGEEYLRKVLHGRRTG